MSMSRQTRKEVAIEETWDVTALFASATEWETELHALQKDVTVVTSFKGKLSKDAQTLLQAIKTYEQYYERFVHMYTYAYLQTSTDGGNEAYQAVQAKSSAAIASIGAQLAFFEPEILTIPEETIKQYIEEEQGLKTYEKMLADILVKKPFTLATEIEETIAALGEVHDAPFMIYERSKTADAKFAPIVDENGEEHPMSEALYEDRYEISPSTVLRRNAYVSYTDTLQQYKNTYAAVYATEVTKQITLAKMRGYQSVTDMLLLPQQVTTEMYHNQLDVIQQELAPHMRKLAELKRREYGLDKMTYADLKAPLDPTFEPETTFEKAQEMVLGALEILGPEYHAIMKDAFDNRWIDYADNVGKQSGAYCSSPYGAHSYILMTWTNMMRGTFTLAHELGHAGHFQLANQHQTLFNTNVSTYFVEAPSTMNELLLAEYLLQKTDDKRMKSFIINNLLDTYYHNFVTHLLEAEFQRRIYDLAESGTPLTADVLTTQKREAIQNFWGENIEVDENAGLIWMRQPHYYMGLYPYTYSAGLTISTAAAQLIKEEGQPAIDRWIEVLKAGNTLSPLELAQKAGVDMTNPKAIKKAVDYVGDLVAELEKIYQ